MATLNVTLELTSTDVFSDTLSLTNTDALTVTKSTKLERVTTSTTSAIFAAASSYTKAYVYLKNTSTTANEIIHIENASASGKQFELGAGEFAFFPWDSTEDLFADAEAGTPVMEVGIFEA